MTRSVPTPAPTGVTQMAKYSEIVALLEYMDRKNVPQKPTKGKTNSRFKRKNLELDFDPFEMLQKEKERLARFEQRVKDWEKLNKKEEKKDEKKPTQRALLGVEWFIIGILSYPFVMYLQTFSVIK